MRHGVGVRRQQRPVERQRRARESGEDSAARRLAQIGILGWMIVTPMLAGIFAGRWLDGRFGSGLTWTGALLITVTVLGLSILARSLTSARKS